MKTCFKCSKEKPRTEFYPHPRMSDGLLGKCKDCTRKDSEANRMAKMSNPDWVAREAGRQRTKNSVMNTTHPIIATARRAVRSLGRSSDKHWHHWSYLKEHHRDVIPLTPDDHRKAHTHMVYDPEQMKYRRAADNILLDTRDEHECFLRQLGIEPITHQPWTSRSKTPLPKS